MRGWWPTLLMVAAMVAVNVGTRVPTPWSDIIFWPSMAVAVVILGASAWNLIRRT